MPQANVGLIFSFVLFITAMLLTWQPFTSRDNIQNPGFLQLNALVAAHPEVGKSLAQMKTTRALRQAGMNIRVKVDERGFGLEGAEGTNLDVLNSSDDRAELAVRSGVENANRRTRQATRLWNWGTRAVQNIKELIGM